MNMIRNSILIWFLLISFCCFADDSSIKQCSNFYNQALSFMQANTTYICKNQNKGQNLVNKMMAQCGDGSTQENSLSLKRGFDRAIANCGKSSNSQTSNIKKTYTIDDIVPVLPGVDVSSCQRQFSVFDDFDKSIDYNKDGRWDVLDVIEAHGNIEKTIKDVQQAASLPGFGELLSSLQGCYKNAGYKSYEYANAHAQGDASVQNTTSMRSNETANSSKSVDDELKEPVLANCHNDYKCEYNNTIILTEYKRKKFQANASIEQDKKNPWKKEGADNSALDPKVNYDGKACSYFTKPAQDEHGLNYYADNSNVCYGNRMYACEDRHWRYRGPCTVFDGWKKMRAEDIEKSKINKNIHDDEE